MSTHYKPWETDTEYGTHYLFDTAGDGIPMHAHVEKAMWHTTRCLRGACELYGDIPAVTLHPGETAEFPAYRMHEIRALEDNTEIVNVFIDGRPEGYAEASTDALSGHVACVLKGSNYLL